MAWTIRISTPASHQLGLLDETLRMEIVERIDRMSESSAEYITRSPWISGAGACSYSYQSEVVEGLRITLVFDGVDDHPPRPMLVAIRQEYSA